MYSKEFESKIKRYVGGGSITPQQRKELHYDANEQDIDEEELDIVIDGYIYLAQHHMLDTSTLLYTEQKREVDTPVSVYPTDEGFNFRKFLELIIHYKWARLVAIVVLGIVFFPFIAVLLLEIISLFQPSSSTERTTARNDSTAIIVNVPNSKENAGSENTTDTSEQIDNSEAKPSTNQEDNTAQEASEAKADNENDEYDTNHLEFVAEESSTRELVHQDVVGMSKSDLRILRNWIYAKHGYIFKSSDLRKYFSNKSWYSPKYADVSSRLSKIERRNVQFIKCYEED